MAIKITRPQGTEDVTPKQIYKWHTVERIARETAENFGFHETRIPTFESTDLFLRSVGETTDVVQKEMYTVKAKETEFTLRPEGTAGTIRSILQNGLLNDALPQKVYYILSCFRHERPQAGRLREFHQFGIEMAGSQGPTSDAEIIALAKTILDRAGLKNIVLNINSIGCPTCRAEYHKALRAYFEPKKHELSETCLTRLEKNPMRRNRQGCPDHSGLPVRRLPDTLRKAPGISEGAEYRLHHQPEDRSWSGLLYQDRFRVCHHRHRRTGDCLRRRPV